MHIFKSQTKDGCEFTMKGRFTFSDNEEFQAILEFINDMSNGRFVTINLAEVDFVDSAAIGMLLLARDAAQKHEKDIIIKDLNGQPKKIFDISHLHDVFNLV